MTDLRGDLTFPRTPPGQAQPAGDGHRPDTARLPVLRSVAFVVLIVTVAATSAYALARSVTPWYGARTELVYELGESQPADVDRLLATQLVLVRSRAVLGPVAADHGLDPEELAERVEAEVLDDSQVIRVTVADADRAGALALVAAVADRYRETVGAAGVDGAPAAPGPRPLSEPYPLEDPLRPRPVQAVAGGTLAGLFVAASGVLLAHRRRLGRP